MAQCKTSCSLCATSHVENVSWKEITTAASLFQEKLCVD